MSLNRYCGLAFASLTGLVAGFPSSIFGKKEHVPTKKGDGRATRPRFVLGRGKDGLDLSISYDSFFGGGKSRLNQKLSFNDVALYFGDKKVIWGDTFCSIEQDGNFFWIAGGRTNCGRRWMPSPPKKTVDLKDKFRYKNTLPGSMSVSSFWVAGCNFTLKETNKSNEFPKKWSITVSDCSTDWQKRKEIATSVFNVDYEIN